MANDSDNIVVSGSGTVRVAPVGTTTPTTLIGAVDAAFDDVGWISDAGITEQLGETTNIIREMGGSPVRTVKTEDDLTYTFEALETNEVSLGLRYGRDNVTRVAADAEDGEALNWVIKGDQMPIEPMILETTDGEKTFRGVLPKAQVVERGDATFVSTDARKFPYTVRAYPDGSGVKAYWYSNDNAPTA